MHGEPQDDHLPPASEMGERVRRWRAERGWTQAQLARKASLTAGTVSRIEAGRSRPLGRTAHQLAQALGVEVERLLGLAGQPALFPLPDERRIALLRAVLGLDDEQVERAFTSLRAAVELAARRDPSTRGRRRKSRAAK